MRATAFLAAVALTAGGAALAQTETAVRIDPEEDRVEESGRRFLGVRLGGGVEGHTGGLNDVATAGPTWGVAVDVTPWRAFNVELGYSGSTAEVEDSIAPGEGLSSGPDIIRNGGHVALTIGPPTALQPYALAGVGFDYYNLRGEPGAPYENDLSASIPVGVGLRGDLGRFSADLRFAYSAMFGDTFAGQGDNDLMDGRVAGTLQIGGTF